ncbi:unnamed protein product, partial [Ectocarpus sp. 12 AP-2014]
ARVVQSGRPVKKNSIVGNSCGTAAVVAQGQGKGMTTTAGDGSAARTGATRSCPPFYPSAGSYIFPAPCRRNNHLLCSTYTSSSGMTHRYTRVFLVFSCSRTQ